MILNHYPMNSDYQSQLFRLAAVLYADNNYEVTPKTILRKVIESALLINSNKPINTHTLIDIVHSTYKLHLDEEEVIGILKGEKDCFLLNQKRDELVVCLHEKRKKTIENKLTNKTIEFFITEFEKDLSPESSKVAKQTIYRFLYELLSTNIESFKKLVNSKNKTEELINLNTHAYSSLEREIINEFLAWDNNDKNKAIFDIASYALEYCMISNNGGGHIQLSNLKNKVFYLDTNVVFRVLGINGENRKKRTSTFLKKFLETNTSLLLSKYSELEFKDTVKYYVDKLKESPINKKLNPQIFEQPYFNKLSEFYDFYYKWRAGKYNDSLDLFEGYILSLFEKFKVEYKVSTDYRLPFDEKDAAVEKHLEELTQEISSHKFAEEITHNYNTDYNDACNIYLIEAKREGKNTNIFETKYFFISTDQSLRRWDYKRNQVTPTVIMPSQWLSILLRYVNRTSDDFKSFVSFLNLPHSETQVDSEKLYIILAGISEMTENFEQQQHLVQMLVQRKFDGILDKGLKNEEILQRARDFAKSELEKTIEKLALKNEETERKFNTHKKGAEQLVRTTDEHLAIINERNSKLKELKKEHKPVYVRKRMLQWQIPAFALLILGILIVSFILAQFFCKDWGSNYPYKLVVSIDNLESDTQKNTLRGLMYTPLIGLWLIGKFCWTRFYKSEIKMFKRNEIEREFDEKYK